jgi:hypothetical protein
MSSNEAIRDDNTVQVAVRDLFLGCAQERASELADMWLELDLRFQLTPGFHEGKCLIMDAGAYRYVRFNHRIVRAFWIAGYAAWEAYRTVAESPRLDALELDRLKTLVSAFDATLSSDDPALAPLPSGVAEPGSFRSWR